MKGIKKVMFLIFTSLSFSSCYNSAFDEILFRTTDDPFDDTPVTDSLTTEHTVYLSWKKDDGRQFLPHEVI